MKQKIGQRKHDQQSNSVKMTRSVTRRKLRNDQNVKLEDDQNVYIHKGHTIVNEKVHRSNNRNIQKKRKLSEAMNQKLGLDRKPVRKNPKSSTLKKPKDETDNADVKGSPNDMVVDLEYLHAYQNVKFEDDHHYVDIHKGHIVVNDKIYGLDDQTKQKRRKLSKATNQKTTGLILRKLKNESDKVDAKGSPNDNVSNFEYLHRYQNVKLDDDHYDYMHKSHAENDKEKELDNENSSDVEILDSAPYLMNGILSPFVPSKRFHKSMMEDDDFQHVGRSSACDEFRKRVLDVLTKPYDKEEYNRLQEAIQAGSYLGYYPDLGRKLKKYRYKHGKRLTIFRGFFFWLQNLTQEGAFKPWNDRDCLAVKPRSS